MFRRTRPYRAQTTPPASRSWNIRYRRFRSHQPGRRFQAYSRSVIASPRRRAGHQEPAHVSHRRQEFQGLNRRGRIHVLRADDGALAHEGAFPDARLRVQPREARVRSLVPRVAVVSEGEGRRRGPDELRTRPEDGTGRVAEHAVDAQALLPVGLHILRILDVFLPQVPPVLPDDVRRHGGELLQEIVEVHDQVLKDREIRQRFDRHRALVDVADVRSAREPRLCAPRDSRRFRALCAIANATSSMKSSSRTAVSSVLKTRSLSASPTAANRSRILPSMPQASARADSSRNIPTSRSMSCCISTRRPATVSFARSRPRTPSNTRASSFFRASLAAAPRG